MQTIRYSAACSTKNWIPVGGPIHPRNRSPWQWFCMRRGTDFRSSTETITQLMLSRCGKCLHTCRQEIERIGCLGFIKVNRFLRFTVASWIHVVMQRGTEVLGSPRRKKIEEINQNKSILIDKQVQMKAVSCKAVITNDIYRRTKAK